MNAIDKCRFCGDSWNHGEPFTYVGNMEVKNLRDVVTFLEDSGYTWDSVTGPIGPILCDACLEIEELYICECCGEVFRGDREYCQSCLEEEH